MAETIKLKEIAFHDFDISESAEKKWGPVFDIYQDRLPYIKDQLTTILAPYQTALKFVRPIYSFTRSSQILYYDEICYIAQRTEMDPFEILLMQLIYEVTSACTTAILNIGDKEFFFRTMDWQMPFLKEITIGLNIKKGPELIGKVTSWLGYVGYLTATQIPAGYTMAINYRRTKDISITTIFGNLFRTIRMKWPVGYLFRYIIDSGMSHNNAKNLLVTAELISPSYLTLYVPKGKSCIITRDCDKTSNIRDTSLIQTNCDWDKTEPDILWSISRQRHIGTVQNVLNGETNVTSKEVLKLLLQHPVLNYETVYIHFQYGQEYRTLITE